MYQIYPTRSARRDRPFVFLTRFTGMSTTLFISPFLRASPFVASFRNTKPLRTCIPHRKFSLARQIASCALSTDSDLRSAKLPQNASEEDDWQNVGSQNQTLFIVDAFGLLFRSYYALSKTTMSSRGMFDTRAIYGFTTVMLSFLQKQAKTNPVAVVFEGRKENGQQDFRTLLYPTYKDGRGPTPTGIIEAVPWVKKICRIMGLAVIEVDVFEADDTIGSLVRKARRAGIRSIIVSRDKDFRQLLDKEYVEILRPGTGRDAFERVTEDTFRKDFLDLHPRQFVDVLALIGDKSDGLKGISGIGTQTAPRIISHYGTLELLLAAVRSHFEAICEEAATDGQKTKKEQTKSKTCSLPLISKKVAESLRDNEQHAMLVKKLITIRENVPLDGVNWQTLQRRPVLKDEAIEFMKVLEFSNNNILERILSCADGINFSDVQTASSEEEQLAPIDPLEEQKSSPSPHPTRKITNADSIPHENDENRSQIPINYTYLKSDEAIDTFLDDVKDEIGVIAVTHQDSTTKPRLLIIDGLALSSSPGNAIYIDCCGRKALPDGLRSVFCDQRISKRGWFLKDLYKALLNTFNIKMKGSLFDNRIAAEVIHAGERITDSRVASIYFGNTALDPWISGREHRVSPPCAPDAALALSDLGLRLSKLLQNASEEGGLGYLLKNVEFPLIPVLGNMELVGVPFSAESLKALGSHVEHCMKSTEKKLQDIVREEPDFGNDFRPTSRDEVAKLIFDIWKIDVKVKKTSAGKFPVNKRVLSTVANDEGLKEHQREFARLMLEHREVSKILSTYTKSLLTEVEPDGRIRTTFVQYGAASGRLSTSSPNLQSIPIRSELGRQVRSTVKAAPGFSMLCADYSQIELRIIASLSKDKSLLKAFEEGIDVHRMVAAKIFKTKSLQSVSDEQRRKAKEVNYGIPYGISSYGLGQQLGIRPREAKSLISEFHKAFPRVKQFTDQLILDAREHGYAKTVLGRRLPLPLLLHGGAQERAAAGRVAVNMPIQGTQADMIKLAMIRICGRLDAAKAKSRMIMQLHDELVLEIANNEQDAVTSLVKEEMASALVLPNVEIVVNTGMGESWLLAAHG